ncbi:GDP-mannose-dependent alpha-(1-6)-phosphatidylinositol monomannoside mannosyltransferase [compost metagenome]
MTLPTLLERPMKITILASDEISAPLYRVRLLAKMLERRFDVEVLGFCFDPDKVDPGAPRDFPYTSIAAKPGRDFWKAEAELRSRITGDLIYAMKPRPTSYGVALRHRAATGIPVVVDVDDWELFMIKPWSKYWLKNMAYAMPKLHEPNNYAYTWALDKAIGLANGRTVVSSFFQKRYGGMLAPQYVDTDLFDPGRCDRAGMRKALGLEGHQVIVFAGIAHPSKGVGDIIGALRMLGEARRDWRLVIVGPVTPYARQIAEQDDRVILLGTQPPTRTPEFLAMADLVVLPQKPAKAAVGQMPMKLYEAMAMGLPVISTAMSDIPTLLDGCGRVVAPGDLDALSLAIRGLLDDPERAQRLGAAARVKIEREYSWRAGAAEVGAYFQTLAGRQAVAEAAT